MQHFRQILSDLDPTPLLAQLAQHNDLWNADDSWTRGKTLLYATNNIVLRYNKTPEGAPPGTMWNKDAFARLSEATTLVFDLMRAIPGEHLGKVMISRLRPGEKIDWHIDHWPLPTLPYWQRYQVPLQTKSGVRFCVDDEELFMVPGTAWWFDNQRQHAVFNDSDEDRISMFADIRPFFSLNRTRK